MQDAPPTELPADPLIAEARAAETAEMPPKLAIEEKADGTVVIDLTPLEPKPVEEECLERDPNPLEGGIIVCRNTTTDQRLSSDYGPVDEPDDFGSAIPRARVKLSDKAEAEVNAFSKGVGGFNANGGEVRVKIDF